MRGLKILSKDKNLVHGILMTILLLAILRIFYSVPTPGVNIAWFRDIIEANQALGLMNMMTGSGLSNMTVMALNITPYITASIIIQLLANVSTKLKDMQKGMRDEQKKLENMTVILGVILALIESVAMSIGYGRQGLFINYTWYWVVIAAIVWAMGTAAASIVGKYIHDKYTFNGTSLILLLNILASYPSDARTLFDTFMVGKEWYLQLLIGIAILAVIVGMFLFVYYIQESGRTVKITYSNKAVGSGAKQTGELPIKLCPGGVVPVIFAASIMTTPVLIAGAFTSTDAFWAKLLSSSAWFNPDDWLPTLGVIIYIALIFGFSYFYADMQMDAHEISENLRKAGGTIAGIRPGKSTEAYIKQKVRSVIAIGAAALTFVAVFPIIISGLFHVNKLAFFGTSIIITVGVIAEIKTYLSSKMHKGGYLYTISRRGGIL